ncbi:MAG: phosphoglucosamine mutase, partial [Dehalococcoidia bacterium]
MGNNHLFGSSGIRGVVGKDLTIELCRDAGQALGSILPAHSRVCIATDARLSRDTVREAVVSGLLSTGTDVTDLGMLPTPALAFLTRELGFDTGIMVTASHNPPEYNGIKLFNGDSSGYSRAQEEEIEKILEERNFRNTEGGKLTQDYEARERYFQSIISMFPNLERKFRIVVDPGNGAASGFASELFSRIGLEVMPLNDEPDGSFPNRNPEPKEDTMKGTIEFLRRHDADLAVCFDGDADRVVFCDREGFLGFTEMIAFISRIMVKRTGKNRIATTVEAGQL